MADKLMYVPNDDKQIAPFVYYNQWLKRLDTQLNEPNNQNSIKFPKVVETTNKKTCYNPLRTSAINSPMSPTSLLWYNMALSLSCWQPGRTNKILACFWRTNNMR